MMNLRKFLARVVPALALMSAAATPALAQQGPQFIPLDPPFTSETAGKQEVLEFFSYACSHCAVMAPMADNLSKEFPESFTLVHVPVSFNASMVPMQHLYYSLVALDRKDLHLKVFDAIHKQKQRLFTRDEIIDWAAKQGIDKQEFTATYDSFGVGAKVKRAAELTDQYKGNSTPAYAVAGKYITSPGMTGTYESAITVIKELVAKETAQ